MACFDPAVLLVLPLEKVLFFLKSLYSSFKRRGWMSNCAEDDLRDEYVRFLEHFRCTYSNFKDSLEAFTDMTALLSNMREFRNRKLLFYLFRLSCLCLTEENVALPPVKFPGVGSVNPPSRLSEVIMPSQSYLSQVPNSVNICTNDVALAKYVELEAKLNGGNVSGDPWSHVDHFGRAGFHKVLSSVYSSLGKVSVPAPRPMLSSSSSDERTGLRSSGKRNKKVFFGKSSSADDPKSADETQQGCSKN